MRWLTVPALFGLVCVVSCDEQLTGPTSVPPPIQIPQAEVPHVFGGSDYFLYGWDSDAGVQPLLEAVLAEGIPITSAWVADDDYPGECLILCPTSLMVRLDRPDPRMDDLGYTQDSSRLFCCSPFWLEYVFDSSGRCVRCPTSR